MLKLKKRSILSILSPLGLFPQVFGQVKEWLPLELQEMIKMSHVVACRIVFILPYDRRWQGGVLKLKRNGQF